FVRRGVRAARRLLACRPGGRPRLGLGNGADHARRRRPAGTPYEQAQVCLRIIEHALAEAGGSLDDVVRTRIYVTDAAHIDDVGRAHGEAFATARPATTGIVTQLLDPRWLVEIEAEAVIETS